MLYYSNGSVEKNISPEELKSGLYEALKKSETGKKYLAFRRILQGITPIRCNDGVCLGIL